jgi:dihydropteroate synthase
MNMSKKKIGHTDTCRTSHDGHVAMNGRATGDVQVMGIINLTDDSFFADSRVLSPSGEFVPETFLSRVKTMIADGASLLDLGACSTRPGSDAADEETEWKRLEPALRLLREVTLCGLASDASNSSRKVSTPDSNSLTHYFRFQEGNTAVPFEVSIDTFRPEIVRKAYDVFGPFIVNDISGGSDEMLSLVGQLGLPYIATHSRGDSKTMQSLTDYDDVTATVKDFFTEFSQRAERFGISDWILDPGFGFAKTVEQNWQLLRELPQLQCFGRKILVGVSRKSMIWKPLGITPAEALSGTQVANFAALQGGADIIRVHDVLEATHTIKLWRLLNNQR